MLDMDSYLTSPKAQAQGWFLLLALVNLPYCAGDVWSLVVSWYRKRVRLPGRNPTWIPQKGDAVSTLHEWKAVLARDLLELHHLEGLGATTRMRRSLKEQEIGQHCCQAGEHLSDADLALLKEALGLDEWQWHTFKVNVRPAQDC
jgi:hypothetical protein